ncbi:hypothetical protein V1289_000507 [Bradyrhizobium sp. AZCC 2289]
MRIPPSSRRRGKLSPARAAVLSVKGSADLRQFIRCLLWRPQRRQRTGLGAFRQICEYRAGLDGCATVVDHQRRDSREPANLAEVWPVSVASSQIQDCAGSGC